MRKIDPERHFLILSFMNNPTNDYRYFSQLKMGISIHQFKFEWEKTVDEIVCDIGWFAKIEAGCVSEKSKDGLNKVFGA